MRTESAAPPLVFQFVGTAQVSAPEHDDARDHAEDKRGSRVHSGTSSADSTAEPPVSIPFRRPGLTGLAGADWLRAGDVTQEKRRRRRPFPYKLPYGGEVR
jgi:hypothetical protein